MALHLSSHHTRNLTGFKIKFTFTVYPPRAEDRAEDGAGRGAQGKHRRTQATELGATEGGAASASSSGPSGLSAGPPKGETPGSNASSTLNSVWFWPRHATSLSHGAVHGQLGPWCCSICRIEGIDGLERGQHSAPCPAPSDLAAGSSVQSPVLLLLLLLGMRGMAFLASLGLASSQ